MGNDRSDRRAKVRRATGYVVIRQQSQFCCAWHHLSLRVKASRFFLSQEESGCTAPPADFIGDYPSGQGCGSHSARVAAGRLKG